MNTTSSAVISLRHGLSFSPLSVLRRVFLCLPVALLAMTGNGRAVNTDTWDPLLVGTAGSNGSGTWTLSSGNFSTSGTTPNSDISPVQGSGDNLTFGTGSGSLTPYTVTINMGRVFYGNGISNGPTMTFANGDYTIAGATTGDGLLVNGVTLNTNVTANVTSYFG